MTYRNRILGLETLRAGDLRPSPFNWRTHPDGQKAALGEILGDVGFAGAIIGRRLSDGSVEIVDGHLRADMDPESTVPVLVTDLTEAEARKILATFDPIGSMAGIDGTALQAILVDLEIQSPELSSLLESMAAKYRTTPGETDGGRAVDPNAGTTEFWHTCPSCGHKFQQ